MYMLDHGICDVEDITWGLRPTRRVPAAELRQAATDIEEALEANTWLPGVSRAMLLGAIGSWTTQRSYTMMQCTTDNVAEAAFQMGAKPTRKRMTFNEGEYTSMRYIETVSHKTLLPCSLLALHLEQLLMLELEALARLRSLSPCGGIIDCLYFAHPAK